MNLKTATLITIIGQSISTAYWLSYSIFKLYEKLGDAQLTINSLATLLGQGSLIYFFVVLHSKQK